MPPTGSGQTPPDHHGRSGVWALVLAAGRGRRFGGAKLHALYRGRPLLSHVLDAVARARAHGLLDGGHVIIYQGDDRAHALSELAGLDTIVNDTPDLGLSHSVRLGLAVLETRTPDRVGAALVLLGDQPLVRVEVIQALVAAWRGGSGPVVRPSYAASRGVPSHPALLDRSVWLRAGELHGDRGYSSLLDSTEFETVTLYVSGGNPDVDTPADLTALEESS